MRLLIILILLFIVTPGVHGQNYFGRDLWLNEANTNIKVNKIVSDKKGYLWLGTDDGLYVYNGRVFTKINDKINRPVTALSVINNQLWVGYANGMIGYVKDAKFIPYRINNLKLKASVSHIYSEGGDILWIATEGQGVICVVNHVGASLNTARGLSDNFVYMLVHEQGVGLIACTDKGINCLSMSGNHVVNTRITTENGLPDNIVRTIKKIPGTTQYWIGTQQGGLAIYNWREKEVFVPELDSGWKWGQVNDILPMDATRAWVATESGYMLEVMWRDNKLDVRPHKYDERKIYSLIAGRSGLIWSATDHGLTLMTAEYMRYIPIQQPFRLGLVGGMTCDRHNNLWYAQANRLYRMSLNSPRPTPELVLTMPTPNISALFADGEDRLWIGTLGKGVWYRNAQGVLTNVSDLVEEPRDKAELKDDNILDVTGTDDRLWVSGINGVKEFSYPGTYTKKMFLLRRHNKRSGIGSDYIYQLYPDRRGRVWMATDGGGVCMYGEGRYRRWGIKDGLKSQVIYAITQDANGDIWAATSADGLYKFSDEKWTLYSKDKGLQDMNIFTLAANNTGQVVVVHAKGIDLWYPGSGQFRNYSNRLTTHFIDSTSVVLKLFAKDGEGNVYIPFDKGFVKFKNIEGKLDIKPVVNLSGVSVFFKPVPFGKRTFTYDQNHISFSFDGVTFTTPDNIHYRYKLEGYNDSWIVTNDESITFAQLPVGNYKFRVQASVNNTFSKSGEASYTFSIGKPFWRRGWFITLMALSIIGIAYAYIRFREENLRKVTSLQRERMMFEYEHLKSQVNPHFLFNSLNTLTNLIEEDSDVAMSYTSRLSDLYRNMLSYRDKDLIYLYEEWAILENYMYIQQSRFGQALRLNANVADELMYSKKIVPMALQILVENAIKHNIVSQSTPLTITIEASEEFIIVSNKLRPKISKEKGAGLGLINIRKRYSLLTKKQISFGIRDKEYIVILPLI